MASKAVFITDDWLRINLRYLRSSAVMIRISSLVYRISHVACRQLNPGKLRLHRRIFLTFGAYFSIILNKYTVHSSWFIVKNQIVNRKSKIVNSKVRYAMLNSGFRILDSGCSIFEMTSLFSAVPAVSAVKFCR